MKLQAFKKRQYKVSVMVIAVLVIASTALFSFDVFSQQANSTVLDMRLAADNYDSATKTFTDRSGNNNDGVSANSAVFETGRYGSVDGAMSFDGSSDYVQINSSDAFTTGADGSFTFSAWVKSSDYSTKQIIISRANPCSNEGAFTIFIVNNRVYLSFYSNLEPGEVAHYSTNTVLENGNFYNIVWTKTWGQLGAKLYINGVSVDVSGDSTKQGTTYNNNIFIGAQDRTPGMCNGGPSGFFNGVIENLKVYNYILTDQEVQDIYESEKVNFSASSLQEGLVGHWSMDEDEYLEGTYNGITYPDFSSGVGPYPTHSVNVYDEDNSLTGKALRVELTGEHSSNRVQFTHDTSFENGQSYIFSIYAKGEGNSIGKNLQTYSGLNWYKDMGPLTSEWKRYDTEIVTGSNSGGPGNIGLEYGVTGDVFYVHSPQLEDKDNLTPFVYGTRNGRLTEKTPYSNHGDTGIEQSFNFSNDRFGNINGAMSFSGSSYIQIPSDSAFNFNNNSFSVSAWVKTSQTNGGIFDTQVSGSRGYRLAVENGTVEFGVYANDFNASYRELNSGSLVNNNKWNLITATYNYDTSLMSIYINGELDITSTQSQVAPSSQDLYIGVKDVSSGFFTGNLDDLRIYNRALSESEIKSLYDSYEPKISAGSLNKGLVLDMPLTLKYTKDETSGSEIMTDKTPYSNDGQNNGATINEEGASFDGVDDYVNIDNLEFSHEMTLSAWIKPKQELSSSMQVMYGPAENGSTIRLYRNSSWGTNQLGWLLYYIKPNSTNGAALPEYTYPINEWTHTVFKYNSDGSYKLYINGQENRSSQVSDFVSWNLPNNYLRLGALGSSAFPGDMYNFKIYNRALSDAEVKSLYDKGHNGFNMIVHPE
jgi:hypothetical protein